MTDILEARVYIEARNEVVSLYYGRMEELMDDAVRELVRIAYKYGHDGRVFVYGMDSRMRSEVDAVISALVAMLEELLDDLCLACVPDDGDDDAMLLWMDGFVREGSVGSGLMSLLDRFLLETEALVAGCMLLGMGVGDAIRSILSVKDDPWKSDLWKSMLEEAGDDVVQPILGEGFVSYGVGRTNVSRHMLELFGDGLIGGAWMEEWRKREGEGASYFRSYIADNTACSECKAEDAKGWQPISEYPDGAWHPHCRCVFIFANEDDI